MISLTKEQESVCRIESVDAINHMSIIACAGSGKTLTATRRLFEIYKYIRPKESIALFSYSNIAVSTFHNELNKILNTTKNNTVHISTFDSFLTEFVIRPHGKRMMGCSCSPYLINGSESFLEWPKFKIYKEINLRGSRRKIAFRIDELQMRPDDGGIAFYVTRENMSYDVDSEEAIEKIKRVAELGGYTHALRNLWAVLILEEESRLVDIISKKFPYILIDEAQDIGFFHADIVDLLSKNSKITLIGDPNQAIYNFAHADGSFLNEFACEHCGGPKNITCNWRSIEPITCLASRLSGTVTTCKKNPLHELHGVYYRTYEPNGEQCLKADFIDLLTSAGYDLHQSAILCRSNDMVNKILSKDSSSGNGKTKLFAESAIERDTNRDPKTAFNKLVKAIFSLMTDVPSDIPKKVFNATWDAESLRLRRALWEFWRAPDTGLPASSLAAKSEWLSSLRSNLETFLPMFTEHSNLQLDENWRRSIRSNNLPDGCLYQSYSRPNCITSNIRIDTVHKAKGESLDSVLYAVTRSHLDAFLEGTVSEEGRIGYVALTRARYLFVIAIPVACAKTHGSKLAELGIAHLQTPRDD